MQEQATTSPPKAPARRWGFLSAGAVIVTAMVVGQIVGELLSRWPPLRALLTKIGAVSSLGRFEAGVFESMVLRDWLLTAFLVAAISVAWTSRRAIVDFFRSMQTGVALVVLSTVAVGVGVLVPQIDNFEDPEQRITQANRQEEFNKFRWAESYFLYHLMHLYGIGMPTAEIPPAAVEGLERYGRVYGEEERKNREVQMRAALAGQAKSAAIEQFGVRHRAALEKAFDVCTALHLNRTYKSNWFATLMWMLGAGILINTFRYPWRVLLSYQKVGFFVTHVGMLTMLSGGFVSNLFTDRGILELELGEGPQDTYYRHYRSDKFARMPFAVKLDRFARKEWKALDVHFLQEKFTTSPPRYTLWPGRRIPLDWRDDGKGNLTPGIELLVREVHDHARVGPPKIREGEVGDGGPALEVVHFDAPPHRRLPEGHSEADGHDHGPAEHTGADGRRALFMAPQFGKPWSDPAGAFRLAVARGTQISGLFPAEGEESLATLEIEVRSAAQGAPQPYRVKLGERIDLPDGYTLEVVAATRDLEFPRDQDGPLDPLPIERQADGVPALWVQLTKAGGGVEGVANSERRLVTEFDAVSLGAQDRYPLKDVVIRMSFDRWSVQGAPRFVFHWDSEGKAFLTAQGGGSTPVALNEDLPLPGETRVTLRGLYERARFDREIEFIEPPPRVDGFDPAFYETDDRGLVLDVIYEPRTPRERVQTVRMATTDDGQSNLWQSDDNRVGLHFLENTAGFPFDWRSVLSFVRTDAEGKPYVVDTGGEKQREIRVNDYFSYGGYRFFQTNADPKRPRYSGIGVVYDPGIEIVLVGMYTIILGTVLAFLVRPIRRGMQSGKEAA